MSLDLAPLPIRTPHHQTSDKAGILDEIVTPGVIVINKFDLVTPEERIELRAILHRLNPNAAIVESEHGRVALDAVLDTRRFDMEKAQSLPAGSKS